MRRKAAYVTGAAAAARINGKVTTAADVAGAIVGGVSGAAAGGPAGAWAFGLLGASTFSLCTLFVQVAVAKLG